MLKYLQTIGIGICILKLDIARALCELYFEIVLEV
jgi:hypothetical protein